LTPLKRNTTNSSGRGEGKSNFPPCLFGDPFSIR